MAKNLEQILGFENLIGLIQNPAGGIPNVLPPSFLSTTKKVEGKTAKWFESPTTRRAATLNQKSAPAKRVGQVATSSRTATMMHSFEMQHHDAEVLLQLQNFDNPQQQALGKQYVAMQVAEFRRRFDNLRLSSIYSILRHGAIYFDSAGELLPTSSSAATTIDFAPASEAATTTWATDTVDIIAEIRETCIARERASGQPIKYAFYGANVPGYIQTNDTVGEFLQHQSSMQSAVQTGVIPMGFGFEGLTWIPMDRAFFADSADTNQEWSTGDQITFTPEPNRDWWELLEGTHAVPTNIGGVSADASAGLSQLKTVNGMFSYATVGHNPVGIDHFAGDTFLPTLKVPSAVCLFDTVP